MRSLRAINRSWLAFGLASWALSVSCFASVATEPVLLAGFEQDLGPVRVSLPSKGERVKEHATEGEYALRADFVSGGDKRLNGVFLQDVRVNEWTPYAFFTFDMYNANEFPITMHVRFDLGDGGTAWDNATAQPMTLTHASLGIGRNWSTLKVKSVLLYNYSVELPRPCSLYFDNFRLSIPDYMTGVHSVKLVDTFAEAPPSPEESARGYRFFHRNTLDIVYEDSKPRPEELLGALDAFGTPGEPEPLTFAVRALRDLGECRASVSDLIGPHGKAIPTGAIEVGTVRCLRKMWAQHGVPFYYESIPAFIQARPSIKVSKDTTQSFWLTVRVPADCPPGLYQGTVRLEAEKGGTATAPLSVRVLPFRLEPVPHGKSFGVYYTTPWQKDHRAQYDKDFRDMRDHGMTNVGLCLSPPLKDYKYEGGVVKLDWDGTSDFEMAIEAYKKYGFPEPLLCISMGAMTQFAARFGDIDSGAYAKAFLDIMKAIAQWGRAHGWPEVIWQPADEPNWHGEGLRHDALRLLHILKSGGFRTEMDGRFDEWGVKALVANPDVDILTNHYFNLQQDLIDRTHRAGQKIQLYNWDENGFQPERMRQVPGLVAWKTGLDGTYTWAYQTLGGRSQYDDLDGGIDDSFYYSPAGQEIGGPSTGWEAYREGVKDYRFLQTLDASLKTLETSNDPSDKKLAAQCRAEVEAILREVKVWRDAGYCGAFSSPWHRDYQDATGQRYCEGPAPSFSEWPLDRFDKVRWQLATMIMKARRISLS